MGQAVNEQDFIGEPPFDDLSGQIIDHIGLAERRALFADDEQYGSFIPFGVFDANGGGFGDTGAADGCIFKLH